MKSKAPSRDKGRRTRARVLDSAREVFIDKGYPDTRVADIVAVAGVSHGSFYTYFDSKEDVFRCLAEEVVDEIYEALDGHGMERSVTERIHAGNQRYLELYARHAGVLGLIEQVATFNGSFRQMRRELRQRFVERNERAVRRMYERGETRGEHLDARIVAHALGGMVGTFCFNWFVLDEPFDHDDALYTLDQIWLRAIGLTDAMSSPKT